MCCSKSLNSPCIFVSSLLWYVCDRLVIGLFSIKSTIFSVFASMLLYTIHTFFLYPFMQNPEMSHQTINQSQYMSPIIPPVFNLTHYVLFHLPPAKILYPISGHYTLRKYCSLYRGIILCENIVAYIGALYSAKILYPMKTI